MRAFWQTKALQSFKLGDEAFPGLQVQTDAQIEDIIRRSLNTIYHAACVCAMGHPDKDNAVVDTHSKVIGVQGLRVVDASAFPILPPGHPQATVCTYCFWASAWISRQLHCRCICRKDGVRYLRPM